MSEYEDVDIQLRMTAKQAREFGERLRDDEFRRRLADRPQETLREYGIEISSKIVPGSIVLPDPSEIDDLLETIPGGSGFRTEADEACIHVILWLIGALARSE